MHAADHLRARRCRGDAVDVQPRSVAGQHGTGLGNGVELLERLDLHIDVLVDRFDDHIRLAEVVVARRPRDQRHPLVHLGFGHTASAGLDVVVALDDAQAPLERLRIHLQHGDGDASVGEAHRDTAAHGAAADHASRLHVVQRRVLRNIGDLGDFPLAEEDVDHRLALRMVEALGKALALDGQAFVKAARVHGGFHALDDHLGCELTTHPLRCKLAGRLEHDVVATVCFDLVGDVANLAGRAAVGDELLGVRNGTLDDVALDHLVNYAEALRLRCRAGVARENELQRLLSSDQPRQPLSAASARQQPELHLGQPDRCGRCRHAVVAAQRDFKAAAERGAVDGGNDRLGAGLHQRQALGETRAFRLAAEF